MFNDPKKTGIWVLRIMFGGYLLFALALMAFLYSLREVPWSVMFAVGASIPLTYIVHLYFADSMRKMKLEVDNE